MLTPKDAGNCLISILRRDGAEEGCWHDENILGYVKRCERVLEREKVEWEEICPTLHVAYRGGEYIGHVDTTAQRDGIWCSNDPESCMNGMTFEAAKARVCS